MLLGCLYNGVMGWPENWVEQEETSIQVCKKINNYYGSQRVTGNFRIFPGFIDGTVSAVCHVSGNADPTASHGLHAVIVRGQFCYANINTQGLLNEVAGS